MRRPAHTGRTCLGTCPSHPRQRVGAGAGGAAGGSVPPGGWACATEASPSLRGRPSVDAAGARVLRLVGGLCCMGVIFLADCQSICVPCLMPQGEPGCLVFGHLVLAALLMQGRASEGAGAGGAAGLLQHLQSNRAAPVQRQWRWRSHRALPREAWAEAAAGAGAGAEAEAGRKQRSRRMPWQLRQVLGLAPAGGVEDAAGAAAWQCHCVAVAVVVAVAALHACRLGVDAAMVICCRLRATPQTQQNLVRRAS